MLQTFQNKLLKNSNDAATPYVDIGIKGFLEATGRPVPELQQRFILKRIV
jgi:hypothetical protein